jgi:hypothetical protein
MSTVTLSKNTLSILKNFSNLNSNILIKPGNVIKTITHSNNSMAIATLEETFDVEVGINDLHEFLGITSLFVNPTYDFGTKSVKIKDGNTHSLAVVHYASPSVLKYPTKDVIMPQVNVGILLTEKQFTELQKASSVMKLPDLSFTVDSGSIVAMVSDLSNPTTNTYKVVVENSWTGPNFQFKKTGKISAKIRGESSMCIN